MSEVVLITIPLAEYTSLVGDSEWLTCLQEAGVDNWAGYDYAAELMRKYKGEKED